MLPKTFHNETQLTNQQLAQHEFNISLKKPRKRTTGNSMKKKNLCITTPLQIIEDKELFMTPMLVSP